MNTPQVHWADLVIIIVYLIAMLGVGTYFMRRQKNVAEYLLASRSVGWFAIGLSLLSSLNSASDYVVGPASFLEWGTIFMVSFISLLVAFPICLKLFIPFYQQMPFYNCYEYLEHRFDLKVRVTSSIIFILWRICWMGFTLYLPAFVLNKVMGFPLLWTVVALGVITTTYTTLGGVRAVVWTDVIQAIIMFVGIFAAIAIIVKNIPTGLAGVWQAPFDAGRVYFSADIPGWEESEGFWSKVNLYIHYPITAGSILILTFIAQLNNYGADQVMIQRYLSARSLKDCKKGFVINCIAYIFYSLLFIVLSSALMAFFQANPVPEGTRYEDYFPIFIRDKMPVVLTGLLIAAVYSAAQSSVSAGISASTSVIYTNILQRLKKGGSSESALVDRDRKKDEGNEEDAARQVVFNRICAVSLGIVVTTLACFIKELGPLFGLFNKIVGNFAGVMIPIFLLGMFSRRVNSTGIAVGAVVGVLAMLTWGFGHQWGLYERALGYGWTGVVGFLTVIVVSYGISFFEKSPSPEKLEWLWKNVMKRSGEG